MLLGDAGHQAARIEADGIQQPGPHGGIGNDGVRVTSRTRLGRRDGVPLWAVTVPANGSATLRYRVGKN